MGTRLVEGVLSGPGPDGTWHWRPEGGDSLPVPEHLVDPEWVNAATVEMQVRRKGGKTDLLGPPDPEPDALLLVDGKPYVAPDTIDLEPGAVGWAVVPFGGPLDRVDPTRTSKRRPVVVTQVHDDYVVVRPAFSTNAEGRGRRLHDPGPAGLTDNSVIGDDEVVVNRHDLGKLTGTLAEIDRRWVLG